MAKNGITATATLLLAACAVPPIAGSSAPSLALTDARTIGAKLDVTYRVLATRGDGECQLPGGGGTTKAPCYEAEITLDSPIPLDLDDSAIFFSQVEPVAAQESVTGARIEHINGDLHRIAFRDGSGLVGPAKQLRIPFTVAGSALTRAKFLPNYYVVDAGGNSATIESTREAPSKAMGRAELPFLAPLPTNAKRAERDVTPTETPDVTFAIDRGMQFVADAIDSGIIPMPANVSDSNLGERVDLAQGLSPKIEGARGDSLEAAFVRLASLGVTRSAVGLPLEITVDENLAIPSEGYEMSLASERIAIRAGDEAGAFYGLQTIAALLRPGQLDVPALEIEDGPRFAFRGMHIDIARNFHGPETLRALIDQMAAYKLNKLHLHLADDEGWRLEIAGLPELTEIGSRRCHDLTETRCILPQLGSGPDTSTSGSGYLSEADYVELVRYATARHVEIIPALDMPGHARAAVKSMEARYARLKAEGASEEEAARFLLSDPDDATEYRSIQHYSDNTINVCRPSAYRFVGHVLDRVAALHVKAGAPLQRYHIGADETAGAWVRSPLCAAFVASGEGPKSLEDLGGYFVARVARMVSERGLIAAAWSDGLSHTEGQDMPAKTQSNVWDTLAWGADATAKRHARHGWEVIISVPDALYFDLPYAAHPEEGGYYWAIRRAPTRKLFSMMPENLAATASYWRDRDDQPITPDASSTGEQYRYAGMQGHIWTETVRDSATLGYQIFPRLLALAERAWHRGAWEVETSSSVAPENLAEMQRDWSRFASILTAKELAKLEQAGWSYRLPPAGAIWGKNGLETSTSLPGLPIECDTGSGWVSVDDCSVSPGERARLRTSNREGTRHGRIVEATRPAK